MRTCKYCKTIKDDTCFYTTNKARCKSCYLIYAKEWKSANYDRQRSSARKAEQKWLTDPKNKTTHKLAMKRWHNDNKDIRNKRSREAHLIRNYGLSEEDYQRMYADQKGKCAICSKWHDKLCVDHDHETEAVRQLLCRRCNAAIGSFEEDVRLLTQAIDYIVKWRETAQSPMLVASDTEDTYNHLDLISPAISER